MSVRPAIPPPMMASDNLGWPVVCGIVIFVVNLDFDTGAKLEVLKLKLGRVVQSLHAAYMQASRTSFSSREKHLIKVSLTSKMVLQKSLGSQYVKGTECDGSTNPTLMLNSFPIVHLALRSLHTLKRRKAAK